MQESQEVREAVELFYEKLSAGDVEGTSRTISADEGSFVIGTQNIGGGRAGWLESVQENATYGIAFERGTIRGFAEGEMGWAVDEPTIVLPDGTRLTARMTAVLRREDDGVLRLVHQHYSWAVPDEIGMANVQAWREQLGLVVPA